MQPIEEINIFRYLGPFHPGNELRENIHH